jgi:transposase
VRSGRSIVFVDESGFMLQPTVRRTWAPRGRTPIHKSWGRRDRLSVLSAVTLAPRRKRLGLYFDIHTHNITTDEAVRFIRWVRRRLGRRIILVWDRWNVHRSALRRLWDRGNGSVGIEWLPAYAPELNPAEHVWNHAKYTDLANFLPDDVSHLGDAVVGSLDGMCRRPSLLRSFVHAAKLTL